MMPFFILRALKSQIQTLRLDMTAQVSIELAKVQQATLIPLSALGNQVAGNRYQVPVLIQNKDSKDKEETREVTIGIRNNLNVQILSGLKTGEKVIISRSRTGND